MPKVNSKIWTDCGVDAFPCIYQGLPLGAKHKSKDMWDPVIEKYDRILSRWKRTYLYNGEKLTLIKSMLFSLIMYYLSILLLPGNKLWVGPFGKEDKG